MEKERGSSHRKRKPIKEPLEHHENDLFGQYNSEQLNDQLVEECEYLTQIHRLGMELHSTHDLEQLLHDALHEAIHLFNATGGYLVLSDQNGKAIRWQASDQHLTASDLETALREGKEREAVAQQGIVHCTDSLEEPDFPPFAGRSLLIAPLFITDEVVGTFSLTHQNPRAFAPIQERMFSFAAETISLAIQNAWKAYQVQQTETTRENLINRLVHDIRSPLMATSASIEVIQRIAKDYLQDERIQDMLLDSMESGKRGLGEAIELTNDLLDVKKMQAGQQKLDYQSVALEMMFDEIHRLLYSLAVKRHVIIRYQVRPRTLEISADARLLRRAMVNLVANALRFSPSGGTVSMEAYQSPDSSNILLVVEDMGPGVPPADRQRIFHPFTQAKGEENRGSGLGLAFCREVALAHQGRIWVEEREGGGSRFCLLIPPTSE